MALGPHLPDKKWAPLRSALRTQKRSRVAPLSRCRDFDGAAAGVVRYELRGESKPSTNSNEMACPSHCHISDLFQDDRQTGTPPHHPLHHSPVCESLSVQHSSTLARTSSEQGGSDSGRGAGTQPVSSLLRNNYRAKEGWTTCTAHPEVTGSYVWSGLRASSDVVPT